MVAEDLLVVLKALEIELHGPTARQDRERLAALLHPEYVEFGYSGRRYTKVDMIEHLPDEQPVTIWPQDFAVRALGSGAALLTYRSATVGANGVLQRHALRSSIWVQGANGWQLLFHQGTPAEILEGEIDEPKG